jgi:hypothetical protein
VSGSVTSQLYGLAFMALMIGLGMRRRLRPRRVRPVGIVVSGVGIVLLIGFGLVGTGGRILSDPIALPLIPVFLAGGIALGWYLVRSMTFWTDDTTGELWMRGGMIFTLVLLATIVLRLAVRGIAYGSLFGPGSFSGSGTGAGGFQPQTNPSHRFLYDLSADLLFLSLGMWGMRALLLYQRWRNHEVARASASSQPRVADDRG